MERENPNDYNYLARAIIDLSEWLCGTLRRNRRYTPAIAPVKVNLGSGLRVAPGWINIDGSLKTLLAQCPNLFVRLAYRFLTDSKNIPREEFLTLLSNNVFFHYELKHGLPLPESSADFIFTAHMLHHLYRDEAEGLLADAFRVLKPGGTIRVAVPNLEYIVSLYQHGERERSLEYFFYTSRARNQLSRRRYQYDFELLRQMLAAAGYTGIRRCAFREGRTPDLEVLDSYPEESLYVEGDKSLNPQFSR